MGIGFDVSFFFLAIYTIPLISVCFMSMFLSVLTLDSLYIRLGKSHESSVRNAKFPASCETAILIFVFILRSDTLHSLN